MLLIRQMDRWGTHKTVVLTSKFFYSEFRFFLQISFSFFAYVINLLPYTPINRLGAH